jgi:predicted anti-sigma-YlaC factor YlaD
VEQSTGRRRTVGTFGDLDATVTDVDCLTCREALSARIDGEAEPAPAAETDAHLETCASCRAWEARAFAVTRTLRVREEPAAPDLADAILEMATPPVNTRGWWPRIALIGVAAAQVGLAISQIVGAGTTAQHVEHGDVPVAGHLFNESTAWNLALGIGLLWAAFRSRVTAGLIPVVGAFLAVLTVYSAYDVITGAASVSRVVSHGVLLLGLALMIVISRWYSDPAPRGTGTADDSSDAAHTDAPEAPADQNSSPGRSSRRRGIRPTGRVSRRRVA